jgi:hypothetical protein
LSALAPVALSIFIVASFDKIWQNWLLLIEDSVRTQFDEIIED